MTKTEKAIQWMENLARDNSHGYDQAYRWGQRGDYDCSSAVITAWINAGVPVNAATYTGNMRPVFLANGFTDITSSINLSNGSGLVRGDVLLNTSNHTAMYCGGGQEVEASINEFGGITGGAPGDQTGQEVLIRSYRNYPWNCILRYKDSAQQGGGSLKKGDSGAEVKEMQKMLIALGYSCGSAGADGKFGDDTDKALRKFQKAKGLTVDGYYGSNTKKALTTAYNNKLNSDWKATGTATCANNNINVRSSASSANSSNIIGHLNKGQRFEVDGKKSGKWVHIKVAGIGIGWMHEDYVKYDTPSSGSSSSSTSTTWKRTGTATCNANDVNVRSTASDKDSKNILGILNKGQRFEVDGKKSGNWVHVKVAGLGIGWIYGTWVKYD